MRYSQEERTRCSKADIAAKGKQTQGFSIQQPKFTPKPLPKLDYNVDAATWK